MAKQIEIEAQIRDKIGKQLNALRLAGLVPAVVYGRKFKSTPITLNAKDFNKQVLQSEAGENLIFKLKIKNNGDTQDVPVITHGVQMDPIKNIIVHVDLMHVVMDEAIKVKIEVELTGMPIGVKDEGGVLVHGLREIEVKCLPSDIPEKFVVDVSGLMINNSLHVSDLKAMSKVEIVSPAHEMIANVTPPTKEEVVVPAAPTEAEAAAATAAGPVAGVEGEAVKAGEADAAKAPAKAAAKAPAKPPKEEKK